jgi:hypothetical protein
MAAAARALAPAVARERGATFWAAAETLLAASLAQVPAAFSGVLLLHPYVTDLALAVDGADRVAWMIAACRKRAPRARAGVHTNLAGEILKLTAHGVSPDVVHVLSSPRARAVPAAVAAMRAWWPATEVVAEVGPATPAVHRVAGANPQPWLHGASALVVHAAADPQLEHVRASRLESAWRAAFPGVEVPSVLL